MRVLLVGPDYEENLSIRYLSSSLLSAGHETSLASFNSGSDAVSVAEAAEYVDIVGLSMCFQSRAQEFLKLARWIKSEYPDKVIVAGGHYASCAAGPLLENHPEIDVIVIHEGEGTLVEIANAGAQLQRALPQIAGIAFRDGQDVHFTTPRHTIDDLDALPFPDRRGPMHTTAGIPTSYLMGSRGCYGSCAYCCITTLHRVAPGKRFRQRSVECIADEMASLYHERGTRQFVFHDDNFLVPSENLNHARIRAFEKALNERGVKNIALVIKCRPAEAKRDVLQCLKELGLVRVFLGIESATARGLSSLERDQTVDQSERALETCAGLDISAQFTLMTFNPDATVATLRDDTRFMRRFSGNPLNFCRAEIYAGTPLEKRMLALGRARGSYLARMYSLADPLADLICGVSLNIFEERCWASNSLMQKAIGLDHLSAVAKRFNRGAAQAKAGERVATWLRLVNLNTIDLLEEVVNLCSAPGAARDSGLDRAIRDLTEQELMGRRKFLSEASRLKRLLESLSDNDARSRKSIGGDSRVRLARQIAAGLLAIGMPATTGMQVALAQHAKAPAAVSSQETRPCVLEGTVTDTTGAIIANATVTITNTIGGESRTLKTNAEGKYSAAELAPGTYTLKAESQGFQTYVRTGIVLTAGQRNTADAKLNGGDIGCCEYAAIPMHVEQQDLTLKKKPFTYTVGDAKDHNNLPGIAKLVYGDSKAWVPIFEANRDLIGKPGFIPFGTALLIPPRRRSVPKVLHRVEPAYPTAAKDAHISGDVVMDVTLKADGTVDQVNVIDGPAELVDAATTAVKQWQYQPSSGDQTTRKFVAVISFGKNGKVHSF